MRLASRIAAASVATIALVVSAELPAQAAPGACADVEVSVLPSPATPWTGAPLRVMLVSEKALAGNMALIAPDGTVVNSPERRDGIPSSWFAEVPHPAAGTWKARLTLDSPIGDCTTITRDITVGTHASPVPVPSGRFWQAHKSWNRQNEALFSAWIAKLFDAPPDQDLSWKVWQEVLRDRSRNFLFNHLGRGEDDGKAGLRPDCADFVYFLRAYFASKVGLPFGYSNCSRGAGGKPPKCYQWFDMEHPSQTRPGPPATDPTDIADNVAPQPRFAFLPGQQPPPPETPPAPARRKAPTTFNEFLRDVGDVVHSGSARVPASEDSSDFYSVALTEEALRPGTVYADPYGHVLMLVHRVPPVDGKPGVFLAVDAEPDGSITRKRFWRGNFLFTHDPSLGTPGFKHFRPVVRDRAGALRRMTNAEIKSHPQYGDLSLEQTQMSAEQFYDRMDDVMSPDPVDPVKAMTDAIASLNEQVNTRVTSIETGRRYQQKQPGVITMPVGPTIFGTSGAWEDYSTPARDFRLLIAIDVVRGFPERVKRRVQRYAMPDNRSVDEVTAELRTVLESELASRKITYTRSDGSPWTLTLKEILDRAALFEMAYNPNDCAEARWGAADDSEEAATCKHRAPPAQRAKMSSDYRIWFHERRWPTRS
ncbi:MAG: hypothetical protein FWD68_19850 [Alphaproteobacteria bacterium]|nr:hypothetical protein [Alphaproteobacteria bacterium]